MWTVAQKEHFSKSCTKEVFTIALIWVDRGPSFLQVETLEDPIARWPGRLVTDLLQLAFESVINTFLQFISQSLRSRKSKKSLTHIQENLMMPEDDPLKDTLIMLEDKPELPSDFNLILISSCWMLVQVVYSCWVPLNIQWKVKFC